MASGYLQNQANPAPGQFQSNGDMSGNFQWADPNAAPTRWGQQNVAGNQAAMLPQHDAMIFDQANNVQSKQIGFLQNMAYYGGGPSQAQTVLQQGLGQALSQASARAASQRGISPALAARMAAQNQASLQHGANVNSTMLRNQEQMQAVGMLQQQAAGEQGFDLSRMQMQHQNDMSNTGFNRQLLGGALNGAAAYAGMPGAKAPTADFTNGASGGNYATGSYAGGGTVPGMAAVQGNSPKNDKVHAMLSPGEVVLPRSVTQSPNMERKAVEFLRHLKAKGGYSKVASVKKMNCGGRV